LTTDIDKDIPLEQIEIDGITRKKFPAGKELYRKRQSDWIGSGQSLIYRLWGDEDAAPFPDGFGEFQYTYSKDDKRISLLEVEGLNWNWEIYSLNGDVFDDIEKFDSMEEAEPRIKELLK
jgi:hypothetical protein